MIPIDLDAAEVRVLGCLAEKDLATPDYYPLSLHAVTAACNQKSNREPAVQYTEADVQAALRSLEQKGWVQSVLEPGDRVSKYRHCLVERLELRRPEQAVLTVLLLRGPQTAGELRARTERLYDFPDLDAVLGALRRLAGREPAPLVRQLERQPGMKENRWAHLLCGEPVPQPAAPPPPGGSDRMTELETRLDTLEELVREQGERLSQMEEALRKLAAGGDGKGWRQ